MKVTIQTGDRLTLSVPLPARWALCLPLMLTVGGAGLFFLLRLLIPSEEPLATVIRPIMVLSIVVGAAALTYLLVFLSFAGMNPVETCTLDKRRGVATIVTRPMWQLWAQQTAHIPLRNITAITLEHVSDEHRLLSKLVTKRSTVTLGWAPVMPATVLGGMLNRIRSIDEVDIKAMPAPTPGLSIIEVSKQVSEFLDVPLDLQIGSQMVTRGLRWFGQPRVKPNCCASCGAPLPPLRPGMERQTCPYCGTTMRVEWGQAHEH